jgi:hypothetical protein
MATAEEAAETAGASPTTAADGEHADSATMVFSRMI